MSWKFESQSNQSQTKRLVHPLPGSGEPAQSGDAIYRIDLGWKLKLAPSGLLTAPTFHELYDPQTNYSASTPLTAYEPPPSSCSLHHRCATLYAIYITGSIVQQDQGGLSHYTTINRPSLSRFVAALTITARTCHPDRRWPSENSQRSSVRYNFQRNGQWETR